MKAWSGEQDILYGRREEIRQQHTNISLISILKDWE